MRVSYIIGGPSVIFAATLMVSAAHPEPPSDDPRNIPQFPVLNLEEVILPDLPSTESSKKFLLMVRNLFSHTQVEVRVNPSALDTIRGAVDQCRDLFESFFAFENVEFPEPEYSAANIDDPELQRYKEITGARPLNRFLYSSLPIEEGYPDLPESEAEMEKFFRTKEEAPEGPIEIYAPSESNPYYIMHVQKECYPRPTYVSGSLLEQSCVYASSWRRVFPGSTKWTDYFAAANNFKSHGRVAESLVLDDAYGLSEYYSVLTLIDRQPVVATVIAGMRRFADGRERKGYETGALKVTRASLQFDRFDEHHCNLFTSTTAPIEIGK